MKTSLRMLWVLLFIVSLTLGPTAGTAWADKGGACKSAACKCGAACQCGETCKCTACPKACKSAACKCGAACQCGETCKCTADACKCPKAKGGANSKGCPKEGACCGAKNAA